MKKVAVSHLTYHPPAKGVSLVSHQHLQKPKKDALLLVQLNKLLDFKKVPKDSGRWGKLLYCRPRRTRWDLQAHLGHPLSDRVN